MSTLFLDTSALAKRYLIEVGSTYRIGVPAPSKRMPIHAKQVSAVVVLRAEGTCDQQGIGMLHLTSNLRHWSARLVYSTMKFLKPTAPHRSGS